MSGAPEFKPFGMTQEERDARLLESRERAVRVIRGEKFVAPTMEEMLQAESRRLGVELVAVKVDLGPDHKPIKAPAR